MNMTWYAVKILSNICYATQSNIKIIISKVIKKRNQYLFSAPSSERLNKEQDAFFHFDRKDIIRSIIKRIHEGVEGGAVNSPFASK